MNKIPRTIGPLSALARRARFAAVELAPTLRRLRGSDAEAIGEDLDDLMGRVADPTATPPLEAILGKQPAYLFARATHSEARAALRVASKKARDFVAQAVDTLKVKLGRRWNPRWEAVGFTNHSLELPAHPLAPLTAIRAYYAAHPEHQAAIFDLTAADAELVINGFSDAQSAVDAAHAAEAAAKQARDAAFKRLRSRMTLLREELTTLLTPEDSRWYRFGFRRPVDGQTPDLVEEVHLRALAPGEAVATWPRSRLADNYRVSWRTTGSAEAPTQVGLFGDRRAIISNLPRGATITIIVTARNGAGESAPVEATFMVA